MIAKTILGLLGLVPPMRTIDPDIGIGRQRAAVAVAKNNRAVQDANESALNIINAQQSDERPRAMRQDADHLRETLTTLLDRI